MQALLRGIDILRLLNVEAGLTATEIGRKVSLPRITAFRLLKTLQQDSFVLCDENRRYRLGPRVQELGSLYSKQNWVIEVAAPMMRIVGERVGWPLVLAGSNGPRMTILHTTRDDTGFWLRLKGPGSQLPILRSALGIAYLAHCPKAMRDALLRAALTLDGALTPEFRDDPERLHRLLANVRHDGIASLRRSWYSESVPLSAVAVPILRKRTPFAALGLTYFQSSMSGNQVIEQFGDALKSAAREIGHSLS